MIEEYQVKNALAQITLARYLITKADQRGLTHGEKHYILQTALHELREAADKLGDSQGRIFSNEVSQIELSDIPF